MAALKPLFSLFVQERDGEYRLDGARDYRLVVPIEEQPIDLKLATPAVTSSLKGNGVNDEWRLKIVEWSFEVVDYFSFDREVVAVAMNYIDRFMLVSHSDKKSSKPSVIGKREYQLLTLTSLYLAIKLHGDPSEAIKAGTRPSLQVFIDLSQSCFTGSDIEQMELTLLQSLKWRVNPPLPITFVKCLLEYLPSWHTRGGLPNSCQRVKCAIYEVARYLTEISVCTSAFCSRFKPSLIAYAAILASMDTLDGDASLSDIFPPYQALVEFFHTVFRETSLTPRMEEIVEARSMLIEICPNSSRSSADMSTNSTLGSANHIAVNSNMQEALNQNYNGREGSTSPIEVIFAFPDKLAR